MPISLSRSFARWSTALSYEDLPDQVVDKVKAFLLFQLVGSSFGQDTQHARKFIALLKNESRSDRGATILWDGTRLARDATASANCAIFDAGLWDSFRMLTHPGPALISAALASAEINGASLKEVIAAIAAGYEFECRLADDFVPSTAAHGFRPSPVFSTMGAAMVTAKLLQLDEEATVAAIAFAANSASGLLESSRAGGDDHRYHEPNAARQGVLAALFATTGARGSELSLEGPAGFYNAFTGSSAGVLSYHFAGVNQIEPSSIADGLGSTYRLIEVMFRMYPCAGYNQPVIDLIAELKHQHQIDSDLIDEITIEMNVIETTYPSPQFPQDPALIPRVGSTHFYAAHAAVNGGFPVVGGDTFGPTGNDVDHDDRVLAFMNTKVRIIGVPNQAMFSPSVTVRMLDGTSYSASYPYSRLIWDFDGLVQRLRACTPGLDGGQQRVDQLVGLVRDAEELPSVTPIIESLVRG